MSALLSVGDLDTIEPEREVEVSGHDMHLVQRLVTKYAEEIREIQEEVPAHVKPSFLFEVFCNPSSQLVQQCLSSQVRAQRFTRERNDLETEAGRTELFTEMVRHRPTHIWFAPLSGADGHHSMDHDPSRRISS